MKFEIQDQDIIKLLDFLSIRNLRIRKIVAGLEIFIERVSHNHTFLISAGIAFNLLLYVIPLLLVSVYVVDIVFGVESVSNFLREALTGALPPNEMTFSMISTTLEEVKSILGSSSLAGTIGIITLIWLSSTLLSSLRSGLNRIYKIETPKIFLIYKLKDVLLIIVLAVTILILSYLYPLISIISKLIKDFSPQASEYFISQVYISLITIGSSFVLFYSIFTFIPNRKMPRLVRYLSIGISLLGIELSRHLFAWYIGNVSSYGKFYGTYAILASLALWMYYFVVIILFSAEISNFINDIMTQREEET